jgi:hypothetical protein
VWRIAMAELDFGFPDWVIIRRNYHILKKVLFLAIHAAARLHNWIMDSENLSYSATDSPEGFFRTIIKTID